MPQSEVSKCSFVVSTWVVPVASWLTTEVPSVSPQLGTNPGVEILVAGYDGGGLGRHSNLWGR